MGHGALRDPEYTPCTLGGGSIEWRAALNPWRRRSAVGVGFESPDGRWCQLVARHQGCRRRSHPATLHKATLRRWFLTYDGGVYLCPSNRPLARATSQIWTASV